MDFKSLFLSTEGRISRQPFWIGTLLLAVVSFILSLLVLPLIGLGGPTAAEIAAATSNPDQASAILLGAIQRSSWGTLVVFIILAYPEYCVAVKRRHDRNNNGLDVAIYLLLGLIILTSQGLGWGMAIADVGGIAVPQPTLLLLVLGALAGLLGIYLLVVLGFLRGTEGPNNFGPDPLGVR